MNRRALFSAAVIASGWVLPAAHAADVTIQPATGSSFVVKDASGANERLRVQESGAISLPGVTALPAQAQGLCVSAAGLLGPCSGGGSGGSYTAATGLSLTGTTFSVAPTYRLPQGCAANQIAQWNGTAWVCGSAGGSLPAGTVNQTLRYDASNALVANPQLQAFSDGGLVAGGTAGAGSIPAEGSGARMMWYPQKAAFRAGYVEGSQWDAINIGAFSVAVGLNTIASGLYSTAMGEGTYTSSPNATAMGSFTTASGLISTAMGGLTIASGNYSTAMGSNTIASGNASTAMGDRSIASGKASTAMGQATQARASDSTALGLSTIAAGDSSTAMGQSTSASGIVSTAMGLQTLASGNNSTAMGTRVSTNSHPGSFIYGDTGHTGVVSNDLDNQFMVVAVGGIKLYTNAVATSGATLPGGSGSWSSLSDRNAKTAVQTVDVGEVLKKVVALPMQTWQYKTQEAKYRHMGPMAQDFYAAFHLGDSDKAINTIDADGVALAAIQGLNARLEEKDAANAAKLESLRGEKNREIASLRVEKDREIAALRAELTTRVAALESLTGDLADVKAQLCALRRSAPVTVALKP